MAFGARGLGSCAWTGVGVKARVLRGFGEGVGLTVLPHCPGANC